MVELLIWFLVIIVIFAVVYVILQKIPLPDPFNWLAQVVLLLIFLIVLVSVLLPFVGHPLLR